MRFGSKLAIALVLLATVVGSTIAFLNYHESRRLLFSQIQSNVLSIAATAATAVDGDLHQTVEPGDDASDPAYAALQTTLRQFRDANRRADVAVRFVYTMRPRTPGSQDWIYVIDAEEPGPDRSEAGDTVYFESESNRRLTLDRMFADETFTTDEFGVWLSGNAPVYNSAGEPVALLGVDLAAGDVMERMNRLLYASMGALAAGLVAAMILALVVARWATRPLGIIRDGLEQIGEGNFEYRVSVRSRDEFGEVADAVNRMASELREREILKGALTRYVSQDVVNQVLTDRQMPSLRGQRREITVLMADIRDFTALSHKVAPEDLVAFLNRYLERMIEITLRNRGTLDKFLGDGILAIFGAPLDDADHGLHALQASREMLKAVQELQSDFAQLHDVKLRIGIALHSGEAIVGNIGSERRMEYTAIGDVVNVTSRIETLNKEFKTELLLSEAVKNSVRGDFHFREVGTVQPRGVAKPLKVLTIDETSIPD